MSTLNEHNIPVDLRGLNHWVLWRNVIRGGREAKVPYQLNGTEAKTNDPSTWSTFEDVMVAYHRGGYAGIGYVFSADDAFVGVDLDGCRHPGTGEIAQWAREIVDKCDTYAEVSPSGTGVKVFLEGESPFDSGKNKKLPQFGSKGGKAAGVEVYTAGRYFTVTGQQVPGTPPNVKHCDSKWIKDKYWPETAKKPAPWEQPSTQSTPVVTAHASQDSEGIERRASAYLANMPPSISGSGGHNALYAATVVMIHGFGLPGEKAKKMLLQEFNPRCTPEWSEREIDHKIKDALNKNHDKPFGWLRDDPIYTSMHSIMPGTEEAIAKILAKHQADTAGNAAVIQAIDGNWPEIKPLNTLPEVPQFELLFLPNAIQPWIADIAERMQAPLDYPAIAALVGMASLIGRQLTIRPKRCDDWSVVPNLWGIIVGFPSAMKTPSLQEALAPVIKLEIQAKEKHAKAMAEWDEMSIVRAEQAKSRRKDIREAIESGESDPRELLASLQKTDNDKPPARRRYLLNDPTIEKVGEIARDNEIGFLIVRDELIGLLRGLEKSGREQDRAFYLEAWNGNSRFTFDRIGRGTLDIEGLCISIVGCTQPGPWGAYLQEAVKGGCGADGLTPRFQLAVWPEASKQWRNVDRYPDFGAKEQAFKMFESLQDLPEGIGQNEKYADLPFVRFKPDAQEMFDDWRSRLEHRLLSGILDEVMESHLAKYRSLIPTLALVASLADGHYGDVELTYVERAIRMSQYLEAHAYKLYASVMVTKETKPAKDLLSRIKNGQLQDGFTARDVYKNKWSGLATSGDTDKVINMLTDHGYLKARPHKTGGRPKTEYIVNPAYLHE